MQLQLLRNATLKIRFEGHTILLDPWLQDKGTGFSIKPLNLGKKEIYYPIDNLPLPPEEILRDVECCLVTHFHPDHFSPDYLEKDLKIFVQNEGDRVKAAEMGFTNVEAVPDDGLHNGRQVLLKTPAIHAKDPAVAYKLGPVSGYLLQGERQTLYIAGDTVYYPGIGKTIAENKPDVIVLNCSDANPPLCRVFMNLDEVEAVCKAAPDAAVVVTHLDSYLYSNLTSQTVRKFAAEKGLRQLLVPDPGEWIDL